jgi:ABC-type dipeptide/oligopeptide/nickel transport system permease component
VTGLFITELLFLFPGVSSLYVQAMNYAMQNNGAVDGSISTGFALFSVLAVLLLMTLLDLLQIGLNPRLRASASEL